MAICFAVDRLYLAVVADFAALGIDVPQVFGWREPARHIQGASRIAWTPGDESGRMGEFVGPRNTATNPRTVGQILEFVTVRISAFDAAAPDDELAQYREARRLLDAWFGSVYRAAYGTFSVADVRWDLSQTERRRGEMVIVTLEIQAPIFDETVGEALGTATDGITRYLEDTADPPV